MDATDSNHTAALAVYRDLARGGLGRLVTSDYVMAESYTLCRLRGGIEPLRRLAALVRESRSLRMLRVTETEYEQALDLMLTREDKRWSFTDCTSFAFMEHRGFRKALTFDRNFAQAGFAPLP